jgi:hypothetical protein
VSLCYCIRSMEYIVVDALIGLLIGCWMAKTPAKRRPRFEDCRYVRNHRAYF